MENVSFTVYPSLILATWMQGGYLQKRKFIGYTLEEAKEEIREILKEE